MSLRPPYWRSARRAAFGFHIGVAHAESTRTRQKKQAETVQKKQNERVKKNKFVFFDLFSFFLNLPRKFYFSIFGNLTFLLQRVFLKNRDIIISSHSTPLELL